MSKLIYVKQTRGSQRISPQQRGALRALGLTRIGSVNYIKDSSSVRGLLNAAQHLIDISLVDAAEATASRKTSNRKGYVLAK